MSRRALVAILMLGLVAGGCTSREEPPAARPAPQESPSPEPPPVAALTGEELEEALNRPVLGVKIDNAEAALPPVGLEAADIVLEEEVEGGVTRFLALYQSRVPDEVGPVRSGREVDAELLPPFQPVLALSGAARQVDRLFERAGLRVMEDDDHGGAFYRAEDRVAPHDLMLNPQPLWDVAAEEEAPVLTEEAFTFEEEAPAGGNATASAHLDFSPYVNVTWKWNGDGGRWVREQNNSDHTTAAGDIIGSDNVVIMRVEKSQGDRVDSSGAPTVELDVIGRGQLVLLRDGEAFRGRWRKAEREQQIELLDRDGERLPLRPGRTWIELLPNDATLELTPTRDSDATTEDR